MNDKLTTALNEQQDAHALLDSYVDDARRNGGINVGRHAELNAAVERADKAAFLAKQANSAAMNSLSPDEYEAKKRAWLDQVEFDAYQKRNRL